VNGICGCGLPAGCCQPAVAGGVIYADLRGELSTHLAPVGFVYSEFSRAGAAATGFPLSKYTGGGDTAPTFSGWRVYLQFMWEEGLPPSLVEFSSPCHFHKLSCSWLQGAPPAPTRASLVRPDLFIYSSGRDSPLPSSALRAPHPLCCMSLLFLLLITQVLFFPRVEVSLSRGLC
jgi:hypothetical protein